LHCWSAERPSGILRSEDVEKTGAHVPEKWIPVFREGHAQTQE
jgi:hypothetical protein